MQVVRIWRQPFISRRGAQVKKAASFLLPFLLEMPQMFGLLFTHIWWQYNAAADWPEQVYHWFNLVEGVAWLFIAGLILRRYWRFHYSTWELFYGLSFVTFGLSDFREAYVLQSGLILFKAINLLMLTALRRFILRGYYPTAKTF